MIKKALQKLIVMPHELIQLLTYSDEISLNEAKNTVYRIYKGIACGSILFLLVQIGIIVVVLNAHKLLIDTDSQANFILLVAIIVIGEFFVSIVENRYVYHEGYSLTVDKMNLLKESLYKYFSPEQSKVFNESLKNITSYFYNLNNLFGSTFMLFVVAYTTLFANIEPKTN